MSISLDLRNFKNPVDRARKIADYREFLKLQQKLNANADRANKEYAKNQTLGITPHRPNPAYASAEEALQDSVEQRIIAMGHIRTIFPYGVDASSALNMLDPSVPVGASHSEVAMFNQNWEGFFNDIKSIANITPEFFGNLWERYKLKLSRTDFTGISLPLDDTKLNKNLSNQARLILLIMKQNQLNHEFTEQQIQKVKEAVDVAIANRDQSLLQKLFAAVQDGNTALMEALIIEARTSRIEAERISTDNLELLQEIKKDLSDKVSLNIMNVPDLRDRLEVILDDVGGWSHGEQVTWTNDKGLEVTKNFTRKTGTSYFQTGDQEGMNKKDLIEAVMYYERVLKKRYEKATSSSSSSSSSATHQAKAESLEKQIRILEQTVQQRTDSIQGNRAEEVKAKQRMDLARSATKRQEAEKDHTKTISKIKELTKKQEQSMEQLAQARQERERLRALYGVGVKKHRKIYGRGISASNQERYAEFGKYIIHLPSLRKSILNLKFPSAGAIPHIPSQHISEELKDFISNLVANGRIDQRFYNKLTKEDKSIFETVAEKADISDVLGIKIENTEKKEAIKRFELLRGEMIAGNDAPEVRTELKQHLIRFMADGTIPKIQGNQILLELSVM
jgi:hypothetical protein